MTRRSGVAIPDTGEHRAFESQKTSTSKVSFVVKVAGTVLRAAFVACLLLITFRVSMPQNETIWTAYDTPGDLVRLMLGIGICIWIAAQLFRPVRDARGYYTWLYFGVAAVPVSLLCLIYVW
jgi:hypothetical protein